VDDLIEGIHRLFHSDGADPVNLGNPNEFTVGELAELVLRLTESGSAIEQRPLPEDDPQVRRPDMTRATRLLQWEPRVPLEEGLNRTIPYFKSVLRGGDSRARTL
jgi:nucleoside-diphosphate-sugar epimerase